MATIQAPESYCCFQFIAYPNYQSSFALYCYVNNMQSMAYYTPSASDMQAAGNFIIAALNHQKPGPINLSAEGGQRTLSMSATSSTITITLYEANISSKVSVGFPLSNYSQMLSNAATSAIDWAEHVAK